MNKKILYSIAKNIKYKDIIFFFNKNNIIISNHDLELIYQYIKNNYIDIIDNPEKYLNILENNIQKDVYYLIKEYYNKYKNEII